MQDMMANEVVQGEEAQADGAETKNKKKKKKKYSRGLKRIQKMERAMAKGNQRCAKALEDGLVEWRKQRDKSAGKKKDGAMKDAFENSSRAVAKAIRTMSRAPKDLTKGMKVPLRPREMQRLMFPFR